MCMAALCYIPHIGFSHGCALQGDIAEDQTNTIFQTLSFSLRAMVRDITGTPQGNVSVVLWFGRVMSGMWRHVMCTVIGVGINFRGE